MKPAAAMLLLLAVAPAWSADLSGLYDPATLEHWGQRYQLSTRKILDRVIWPALLPSEQRRLGGRPRLEVPLLGDGPARGHPLSFYRPVGSRRIVFPALSLKFLDDLCTAYAWLQIHGYGLETISEYTAILAHAGRPPPGGFPRPLEALGVPANALEDPRVDELALGHFVTARTFILLHEMGHILHDHAAAPDPASRRQEQEADAFAVTVMGRTPLEPLGMLVFFLADAHWSGYPPVAGSHPLSGERVAALAAAVRDRSLARRLREFGRLLDDPELRAGFEATGRSMDFAALGPRRPGERPAGPQRGGGLRPFEGRYEGQMRPRGEDGPIDVTVLLQRDGNRVRGRYSFGIGIGHIEGEVRGERLHYRWEWAGRHGRGVLIADRPERFRGTWGLGEAEDGAGHWQGRRRP